MNIQSSQIKLLFNLSQKAEAKNAQDTQSGESEVGNNGLKFAESSSDLFNKELTDEQLLKLLDEANIDKADVDKMVEEHAANNEGDDANIYEIVYDAVKADFEATNNVTIDEAQIGKFLTISSADLNKDGIVNMGDLVLFARAIEGGDSSADIDGDGVVDKEKDEAAFKNVFQQKLSDVNIFSRVGADGASVNVDYAAVLYGTEAQKNLT